MIGVLGRVPLGQRKIAQAELCQDLDCSRHVGVHRAGSLSRRERPHHGRVGHRTKVPTPERKAHSPYATECAFFTQDPMPVPHRAMPRADRSRHCADGRK